MALFKIDKVVSSNTIEFNGVEFNHFSLSDKEKFDSYYYNKKHNELVWETCFAYLYPFSQSVKNTIVVWKEIHGHLCVFEYYKRQKRMYLYTLPVGKTNDGLTEALMEIFWVLEKVNGEFFSALDYFPKTMLEEAVDTSLMHSVKPNYSDFIFRIRDLIELRGKRYKTRRNMANKFKENYPNHLFRPCTDDDMPRVMEVRDRWMETKFGSNFKKVWDYTIFQEMMKHVKELDIDMFVMEIDGIVEGFISVSKLGSDCSIIINENTNLEISGLAEVLWYNALEATEHYGEFSNDGNGGDEKDGLYKYKMSHRPYMLIDKVVAIANKKKEPINYSIFKKQEGSSK